MANLIKISIDDLPPATTINNSDVFVIDQLSTDGYTKKITYKTILDALSASSFVNRSGDTMAGRLYLSNATPTGSAEAASKSYVDTCLKKSGGTMTGTLLLSGGYEAASKLYVIGNFAAISSTTASITSLGAAVNVLSADVVSLSSDARLSKAWATFSATTSAISAAYNISTAVTRTSAGDYTFSFIKPMTNALYAVNISDNYEGTGYVNRFVFSQATTGFRIKFKDNGTANKAYDPSLASILVFGN